MSRRITAKRMDTPGIPDIGALGKTGAKAVRAIFCRERPTRRSIAQETHLSLVKVSSVLGELEARQIILKDGKTQSSGGRPSHVYALRGELGYTLGLNLRLDEIRVVAMDCAKGLLLRSSSPLSLPQDPSSHQDAIVDSICAAIEQARAALPDPQRLLGIGLALPGMVDTQRGIWLLGLQLTGITHIPIAELLTRRLGVPVLIEDAARALAFLEMYLGEGRSLRDFVLLYLGLGVGAGVVVDRKLYRGSHGLAGEIGHIEHPQNNYRCSCGNVGCLETVVSPAGILRVFRDRLEEGVRSQLQSHGVPGAQPLSLETIRAAAVAGDRLALSTLGEIAGFLGDACAMLIKLFNPQALIISGEVTLFADFLREPVERVIFRHVLPEMLTGYGTRFADHGPHAEAHGAALMGICHVLERLAGEVDT
ncbi:MAG: ROK family protein [Spirochaetales bacterium]|nr:ROK family protein [Spirochaetales bacterium]